MRNKGKAKKMLCTIVVSLCMCLLLSDTKITAASINLSSSQIASYFNSKVGKSVPQASCLAFIADTFAEMGAVRSSACCAYNYANSHIVSTSMNNIPVGADVYLNWNSKYAGTWYVCPSCGKYCHHIGVYVGDGYVVHTSSGKVVKTKLSELINYWNVDFRGWGYHGNVTIGDGASNTDGSWLKATGVTNITETTARINASLSPGATVSEAGFYLGTSPNNMQKTVEVTNASVFVESAWYDLGTGKWSAALSQGTTYYYQIYVVIGGVTYKTALDSFTTKDSTPPVISNTYVTDVTDDGYTVVCNATDNVGIARVCFPTWTDANGQDDLSSDWYNNAAATAISGNTYSFRVNRSAHNNESGMYTTHIYAYDLSGNYVSGGVQCGIYPLQSISLSASYVELTSGQNAQLAVNYNPSNTTTNKAVAWTSSNNNVATVDGAGKVTAVAAGQAVITANVSGRYAQCTVTVTARDDADTKLRDFVDRMYTVALGRQAEAGGVDYWKNKLLSHEIDGAGIAQGFILSPEFKNKGYANAEYIRVLYRTFFDRDADSAGIAYWNQALNSGQSRESVLSGFVNSSEFDALCLDYGISRGFLKGDGTAINSGVCRFAERLYTMVLGRNGEKEGVEYWTIQIANGACTPEMAAQDFFMSDEYKAKNTSDEAYVKALYATFMDREAEADGIAYWKNLLNSGASREAVLGGFAQSVEFKGIMESFGL